MYLFSIKVYFCFLITLIFEWGASQPPMKLSNSYSTIHKNISISKGLINGIDSLVVIKECLNIEDTANICLRNKVLFNSSIDFIQTLLECCTKLSLDFIENEFRTNCLGKARKKAYNRWLYYQKIDPEHKLYIKYDLPDSSDLIYAYKKRLIKIDKNCPCELTKQGVINLKYPGKPCKDYAFRLVAYFVKKEDVFE